MDLPFQPFGYGVVIGGQIRQVFGAMGAVQFTFDFLYRVTGQQEMAHLICLEDDEITNQALLGINDLSHHIPTVGAITAHNFQLPCVRVAINPQCVAAVYPQAPPFPPL